MIKSEGCAGRAAGIELDRAAAATRFGSKPFRILNYRCFLQHRQAFQVCRCFDFARVDAVLLEPFPVVRHVFGRIPGDFPYPSVPKLLNFLPVAVLDSPAPERRCQHNRIAVNFSQNRHSYQIRWQRESPPLFYSARCFASCLCTAPYAFRPTALQLAECAINCNAVN